MRMQIMKKKPKTSWRFYCGTQYLPLLSVKLTCVAAESQVRRQTLQRSQPSRQSKINVFLLRFLNLLLQAAKVVRVEVKRQ